MARNIERGNPKAYRAATLVAIGCLLALAPPGAAAAAPSPRFFFSGDGAIELRDGHGDRRLAVRYRDRTGHYDPEALAQIQRFFRSRRDGAVGDVSLRLIELIDFVEDRYHPSRVTLISGYRSPEYNENLRERGVRAARASLHTEGLAADLHFTGVNLRRLWLTLRDLRVGGVGLYEREGFLHLDTGRARFWEPQTSRVEEDLSADNARLFARTDFDRYEELAGAVVRLHSLTALPIRIARRARVGAEAVAIEPMWDGVSIADDCYVIARAADRYQFRVTSGSLPAGGPMPIVLTTCAPRVGKTPAEIESNAVERIPRSRD